MTEEDTAPAYAGFAHAKARLSWRHQQDSAVIQKLRPYSVREGDTTLWGSVALDGIVVGPLMSPARIPLYDPNPAVYRRLGVTPPAPPSEPQAEVRREMDAILNAAADRGWTIIVMSADSGAGPESSAGRPIPDGRKPEPGGWNRIHFVVDDIASEVERLRAAGVSFRNEIVTGPGGSQILLEDPSGNPIELFQPAA